MGSAASNCPVHSNAEESSSVSDHSHIEEDAATEGEDATANKHETKTISNDAIASDGEEEPEPPPSQDTLNGISQVFGTHKDSESDKGEKVQSRQKK